MSGSQTLPPAPALEGWTPVYSGKVRDLYVPAAASGLDDTPAVLVVATDRVSAFDFVLEPGITDKGALLTRLSLWWFDRLDTVPNHLLDDQAAGAGGIPPVPPAVADRSMLVKPLDMFPVECVVRGYLVGSGWLEYQEHGTVCGIPSRRGSRQATACPEPIYTPAFKADFGDHDENITYERTVELVGADVASRLRDLSLEIFRAASAIAEEQGVILADTKFEFGADRTTGEITLGDEVLTSDSSRYWDKAVYASGNRTDSFDKQIVRNWLTAHWDRQGTPPALPAEVVAQTSARYAELLGRLTGAPITPD